MAVLQVRNLPEATHQALKRRAAGEGISLTAYVVRELNRVARRADLEGIYSRVDAADGSAQGPVDSAALVASGRAERPWD